MTRPIDVAVFDDHEIFRRGALACIGDDDGLRTVVSGPAWVDDVEVDVAVVGERAMPRDVGSVPLVVCMASQGRAVSADRADVFAVLDRHQLSPAQLVEAVRAEATGLRLSRPG